MQTRRLVPFQSSKGGGSPIRDAGRGATAAQTATLYPVPFQLGSRIRTHLRTLSGRQVYLWSTDRGRSRQVIKH